MSLGAQVSEIFSAQVSACPSHSLHAGVFWFVFALQKCCNRYVGFYVLLFPQDLHFFSEFCRLGSLCCVSLH